MSVLMRAMHQTLQREITRSGLQLTANSVWEKSLRAAVELLAGCGGNISDSTVVLLVVLIQRGMLPVTSGGVGVHLDLTSISPAVRESCNFFAITGIHGSLWDMLLKLGNARVSGPACKALALDVSTPTWLRGEILDLADIAMQRGLSLSVMAEQMSSFIWYQCPCPRPTPVCVQVEDGSMTLPLEFERDVMDIIELLDAAIAS
eukprot:3769812-Rhodomonas_salina.2